MWSPAATASRRRLCLAGEQEHNLTSLSHLLFASSLHLAASRLLHGGRCGVPRALLHPALAPDRTHLASSARAGLSPRARSRAACYDLLSAH